MQCQHGAFLGAVLMHSENALRMSEGSMFVIICTPRVVCCNLSCVYETSCPRLKLVYADNIGIVAQEEHGLDEHNPDALIP